MELTKVDLPMTDGDKQRLAKVLLAAMDQGGIERRAAIGIFAEDDYAAGALNILNALGLWDYVGGRALLMLSGTTLALGPGQKRPTDQDKLKHYLAEVKRIMEGNCWEPAGTVLRNEFYNHDLELVAWHDGTGGFMVGKVQTASRDPRPEDGQEMVYFRNAETAEQQVDDYFTAEGLS
jgi:hypothetical protein